MSGPPERLLLDTNAVVSLLRGHGELLAAVRQAQWVGVSIITEIEFLAFPNLPQQDIALFSSFLDRVSIVDLAHHQTALRDQIIDLRRNLRLRLPDAVIVASAIFHEAGLVTADRQLLGLENRIDRFRVLAFNP
jgi:hypothetical protein